MFTPQSQPDTEDQIINYIKEGEQNKRLVSFGITFQGKEQEDGPHQPQHNIDRPKNRRSAGVQVAYRDEYANGA